MMFVVTHIRQFSIDAESKEIALEAVKAGGGQLITSQDVVNAKSVASCQMDEWPIWAKAMRQLSKPGDRGIGDVVARIIGDENSAAFKVWFEMTFGRPCGCAGRQAKWNRLYPLK